MTPKLSIIVPIYKVEQYIRKCVDSVLQQDIPSSEYEIILVDDGSPDGCPAICDSYVAEHENIRVIHQENGGLSAARNAGLKIAKGEYVCFLDSDDYWEPNKLGALMMQIDREQLDVLRFNHQNVRQLQDGRYEVFQPYKAPHFVDNINEVVDGVTYLSERMGYACYACQFIMRRGIVSLFTPNIHFEDVDWLPRMLLQVRRVNSTPIAVYNYLHRPGSITQTQGKKDKVKKNVDDFLNVIKCYNEYISQYPNCVWLCHMRSLLAEGVIANVAQYLYDERDAYLKRLYSLNVFPLTIGKQGLTYLKKAILINISPRLAILLLHIKNK